MYKIIQLIPIVVMLLICSCNANVKFPKGGHDYPVVIARNVKDSFYHAYYGHYWNVSFDEPDLNIKPQKEVVFRIIYETAFGMTSIFTMTQNEIVIKQLLQGRPYPNYDTTRLNLLERFHLRIMKSNFPIQELNSNDSRKAKSDSLVKIYPKLLSPAYYKYLLDKASIADSITFRYTIKKVKISNSQYLELVNQINSSGYWALPIHIKCDGDYLDGYGFSLEANTPTKYKIVSLANCPEKALAFSKACQALIDATDVNGKIKLISDKERNK